MNTQKIKLVRIISRLNVGGPAKHVQILCRNLPKFYENVLIYGKTEPHESDFSASIPEHENFKKIFIPELKRGLNPISDTIAFLKILKILYKEKPHILCTHASKAGVLGRLAGIVARVPVRTHTFHGTVFKNYFGKIKSFLIRSIEKCLSKPSTAIIAISNQQTKDLVEIYQVAPPQKVHTIPLGLELDHLSKIDIDRNHAKKIFNIPENKLLIGFVGRLVSIKNIPFFLEIAHSLLKIRKDIYFVIVGDGPCQAGAKTQIDQWNENQFFHFLGWQQDLASIYRMLDILLLTSKNEGTPVAIIEALACQVPVVATRVGGVEDVVFHGKNGYAVDPSNQAQFLNCVLDLIDHPEKRIQMGTFGKSFVLKTFSQQHLLQNTTQLYQTLLHKHFSFNLEKSERASNGCIERI